MDKFLKSKVTSGKMLTVTDAVAIVVGIVVSVGIFKTPSLVAAYAGSEQAAMLVWLAGGVFSLIGALCYAELASTFPHAGGDYHYMYKAFGGPVAFLFAWARMTVIQPGSIAVFAFVIGDYVSEVFRLGSYSSSYYAMLTIVALTVINIAGLRQGLKVQRVLLAGIIIGLLTAVSVGLAKVSPSALSGTESKLTMSGIGKAMIFALFTYGGWNEAAYISAEIKNPERNIVRGLIYSIGVITALYLLANFVFIKTLGIEAVAHSEAVAADLLRTALGENGARFISVLISVAALSTMNGIIITGARTNFALGRDFELFGFLGHWHERGSTPRNALLLQAFISLFLVIVGTATRSGFEMMVEYTAPVFWFFFFMAGVSLFVLRKTEPDIPRPFRVPLYPLTPFLFCLVCLYLLQSSLAYTGKGALMGVIVLLAGLPFIILKNFRKKVVNERSVD